MQRLIKKNDKDNLFYDELPINKINYTEMRSLIQKRRHLLQEVEKNNILPQFRVDEDIISFFALLLVNVKNEDSTWISQEIAYFNYKLSKMSKESLKKYFYTKFLPKLTLSNGNLLKDGCYDKKNKNTNHTLNNVYFLKVIDLITQHKVIPEKGFVKFEENMISSVLMNEFRNILLKYKKEIFEFNKDNTDDRFSYFDKFHRQDPAILDINNSLYDVLKCLPPCVWQMIETLKEKKHLYNTERLIVSRFFHSVGVKIDDLIPYLKGLYQVSEEEFNKSYLYNIKHVYGLEGKRADYKSFPCTKIIFAEGRCSGCPFYENTIERYLRGNEISMNFKSNESPKMKCALLLNKIKKSDGEVKEIGSPDEFTRKLLGLNW
ncbi:putative DNA primase large subunit [Cucumispora dikerogammari]|nr:putative DNA primase large subunit [Cucumispora dikerogammari]